MSAAQSGRAGRLLEPVLRRYHKSVRRRLRRLAKGSSRFGDLLEVFPAAAFAMGVGRGPAERRGAALRLVKDGASLKQVAAALELPTWTRRLPPEAFQTSFGVVPDSAEAARQLPNAAPVAQHASVWFEAVLVMHAVAGEEGAFWIARRLGDKAPPRLTPAAVALLAAWVWASSREELLAARAIHNRFRPTMSVPQAATATLDWLDRAIRVYGLAERGELRKGAWFKPQSVCGYKFSPRMTAEALAQEGEVMNHCVGTYAGLVQSGVCLIYAIRRGGSPVATLEVRAKPGQPGRAFIAQLQGPSNRAVDKAVARAAETFLARQGPCPLRPQGMPKAAAIDTARWAELWGPLRGATSDPLIHAMFPDAPTDAAMMTLSMAGGALRRAAGV